MNYLKMECPTKIRLTMLWFAVAVLCTASLSCGKKTSGKVVLTAPFGPLAYPFVYMAGAENSPYELTIWRNPDQLRAMIAGGQADYYALPTNVAAIFHNKGADLALLDVSVWSVLWMVSTDSTKTTLADFRGEDLIMPFRGDMPHIVFETVARERGLDPERDFRLRYVATPQDAVQQLLLGRSGHAVLCEPDLSILMHRAGIDGAAPEPGKRFFRVVDLQKEWDTVFGEGEAIPIGGVAASAQTLGDREAVRAFQDDYTRAVEWCTGHPQETASMVARFFEGVPAEPIAEAIRHVNQHVETAVEARVRIESFFGVLYRSDPATIGGKLPGDPFYRGE
jgi:NitT/TauT family transport system substrate-binding protein